MAERVRLRVVPSLITVKARLTVDEWHRFNALALMDNESPSEVLGRLMREHLEQNDPDGVITRRRRRG